MLVTQGERKRPGLADGMMSDKGKKRWAKKSKQVSKEKERRQNKHAR
jgi:hypothetical protein